MGHLIADSYDLAGGRLRAGRGSDGYHEKMRNNGRRAAGRVDNPGQTRTSPNLLRVFSATRAKSPRTENRRAQADAPVKEDMESYKLLLVLSLGSLRDIESDRINSLTFDSFLFSSVAIFLKRKL